MRAILSLLISTSLLITTLTGTASAQETCKQSPTGATARACTQLATGDQAASMATLEEARAADPKDRQARELLVTLYKWNSRANDLPAVLEELLLIAPQDEAIRIELATILVQLGSSKDAVPHYQWLYGKTNDLQWLDWLIKIYGWNSMGEELVAALEVKHARTPDDMALTNQLAQHYEWSGRGAEAIPLLETIVERDPENIAARKRLAMQLAGNGEQARARRHLHELIERDPDDLDARYLMAQIDHWSVRWPSAKENYRAILESSPAHADARKYLTMLDEAHAPVAWAQGSWRRDSNDVTALGATAHGDMAINGRTRVKLDAGHLYLNEQNNQQFESAVESQRDHGTIGVAFKAHQNLELQADVGWEVLFLGRSAPLWHLGVQGQIAGWIYPQVHVNRDSFTLAVNPIFEEIYQDRVTASVYAEPVPWLAFAGAYEYGWLSDDNRHKTGFAALWFTPLRAPWLVRPNVTYGFEDYTTDYPAALPYFTQPRVHIVTPGVDLGFSNDRWTLELGYGLAIQTLGPPSHMPRAKVAFRPWRGHELQAKYLRSGSSVYTLDQASLTYSVKFGL